jgi:malonyl-CoA O-methyltransferase
VEAMVADLRATGQTCALAGRARGLLAPAEWARAREALQDHIRNGRLPATMEVIYGHAWKPAPRRTADGHAIVMLDTLQRKRE